MRPNVKENGRGEIVEDLSVAQMLQNSSSIIDSHTLLHHRNPCTLSEVCYPSESDLYQTSKRLFPSSFSASSSRSSFSSSSVCSPSSSPSSLLLHRGLHCRRCMGAVAFMDVIDACFHWFRPRCFPWECEEGVELSKCLLKNKKE